MPKTEQLSANKQERTMRTRGPEYPRLNLKDALDKAKSLHEAERKSAASMESAFAAWGHRAKSSTGHMVRAALGHFGLITIEGGYETGKVKLTGNALRAILDQFGNQIEKRALMCELALMPKVHKELYEQFPDGIKSDAKVECFLVSKKGFGKIAASQLLTEFKATAGFAELYPPKNSMIRLKRHERVIFVEEKDQANYLKLIASGDVDRTMLEALEDYVRGQRKRRG